MCHGRFGRLQPPQIHPQPRSIPCPSPHDMPKNTPKPDSVAAIQAQERLARDHRQAQHATKALQQALDDLGLPQDLVTEIEGRLRSQQQLLGKIVGMMCPPLFGCRTNAELCRVRGWDKNLPSRLLNALPKRSWIKRLRRLGLEVLVPLWRTPLVQVRPRGAAGSGPGWVMIPCSKSMESSWDCRHLVEWAGTSGPLWH